MKRCIVVLLVAAVSLFAGYSGESHAKDITIKMTGHMPVGHSVTLASQMFQKEVEKRSNGTMKFQYFPAGQLAMDMKAFELCKSGGVDMIEMFVNRTAGVIPESTLMDIPTFGDTGNFARQYYDTSSGGAIFINLLRPLFAKQGLYLMPGFLYSPEHCVITNRPVEKLSDYKGMKLRSPSICMGYAIQAWGAVPTVMGSSDVYLALQRGTIEGANSGVTTFVSRKWFEVASHVQYIHELAASVDVVVNMKFWEGLTPEQQNIIKESLRGAVIWSYEKAQSDVEGNIKFLRSKGVTLTDWLKEKPDELEKMRKVTLEKMDVEIPRLTGDSAWKAWKDSYAKSLKGSRGWKEVISTVKY